MLRDYLEISMLPGSSSSLRISRAGQQNKCGWRRLSGYWRI
jgi:hypothetical protein